MEEDIKKMEDEAINLIGCDTIVNSPSLNLLSPLNRLFSESSFSYIKDFHIVCFYSGTVQ